MSRSAARRRIVRVDGDRGTTAFDVLAGEEPLEIRLDGEPLAVTMRTPGHDFELATGWLIAEGIVGGADDIRAIRYCVDDENQQYNVLSVDLRPAVRSKVSDAATAARRGFVTSSSCGLCGKASIGTVRARAPYDVGDDPLTVTPSLLASLPARLREAQRVFDQTGGLHAAGLFAADGELLCLREDVGRHNAFDKVIGWAAGERRLPLRGQVLLASGRASFELVQKALVAGAPALAAVSAPSSLAVELAEDRGMTLVGFLRGTRMNVYTGAHRVRVAG